MVSQLLLGLVVAYATPQSQYRDPQEGKLEERRKFHFPSVTAMPTSVRLDAYEKRMQMLESSPFKNIPWRSIGSEVQGGRVIDIAVPREKPQDIYIAYATGGLWRSSNEGQSWTPLFDNQSSIGIGDIDMTPDGQTIWLGSGEANSQRTSYAGTGVFKSTDSGATWQNMGLHESHHIGRVVIHPRNPNTVYVASLGPLYSQGGQRGLYRTTNGGQSWELILEGDDRTGCMDVLVDPTNPDRMYATMYERDRRAWNYLESGPGSASYRSTDGGDTWVKMDLPEGVNMGRTGLDLAQSSPNIIYAFMDNQGWDDDTGSYDESRPSGVLTLSRFMRATEAALRDVEEGALRSFFRGVMPRGTNVNETVSSFQSGDLSLDAVKDLMLERNPRVFDKALNDAEIWRSDDYGVTWSKTRPDMGSHGGYYWNEIVVHPTNPDEIYTFGVPLLRSRDAGKSWEAIARRNHVDHHALWIDPDNPNRMINGNDGGPYVSYDAGESWTHWNNLSVGQFTTIAVDDATPYRVYGGLQDNGTLRGPSNYRPGFTDKDAWERIGGGDGSMIQVDPRGNIYYVASQFGNHSARNEETNERWSARKNPSQGEPSLRYNWISPILISPHHPDIVYLGAQRLMRSFNNGRAYEYLSGDLTKDRENGDVPHSTLTGISESPFKFGRIYVGADDGSLHYTPDSGITWNNIATPAPDRWVTRVIASKYAEGRVYVSQNGYRQDEWTPYVWVSEDFGRNWTSIAANLPFEPVNTIREDPTDENILYVGTDRGVYVSLDRGKSWITYGSGVPHTPVHDLAIQETAKEMVIASHARSVWAVSVDWLYEADAEVRAKDVHEFDFDVPSGRANWPYPRSAAYADPQVQEREVELVMWAKNGAAGKFEIHDADGKVVKSGDVTVDTGINFLAFGLLTDRGNPNADRDLDVATTGTDAVKDPFQARRPEYLPEGEYKLVLTWGGQTFEKEFEID